VLPAADGVPEVETIRLIHEGEVDLAASELLAAQTTDERADRDEAVDFLAAELAGGERPVTEVGDAAKRAGIGPSALKRAKRVLGVKSSKEGMDGGWTWCLPEGNAPKEMLAPPSPSAPSAASANQAGFAAPSSTESPEGDAPAEPSPSGVNSGWDTSVRLANPAEERIERLLRLGHSP
jgi:hypothetical protein